MAVTTSDWTRGRQTGKRPGPTFQWEGIDKTVTRKTYAAQNSKTDGTNAPQQRQQGHGTKREVNRLRVTFGLIVAHSRRPNRFRSSLELMDESSATMDTMDKEDWGGPSGEEEICLILQQSAALTPRQEWTEYMQDVEPDGVNIAIDTPGAGEDPQRSGGQKAERERRRKGQTWKQHRPNRHSVRSTSHRDHQQTGGNEDGTTGAHEANQQSVSCTRGKQR